MRAEIFDALAPVCPRCLHADQTESPLRIADVRERRGDHVWQGIIHCANAACWQEYPVLDGVPVLTPDPRQFMVNAHHHILARADLDPVIESLIGDALGPGHSFDQTRQHLSLYAGSHLSDWSTPSADTGLAPVLEAAGDALMAAGSPGGGQPAIDLGCAVGRGTWALAARTGGPVVGADLNFSMLSLAQKLAVDGQIIWPRRRLGIVYDPVLATLPENAAKLPVDFWAMDAMALPFRAGQFAGATAVNLVDCIPGPTNLIAEMARVLVAGAPAVLTTPYDWSPTVAEPAAWMGGHSQRGPGGGAAEPVLTETLRGYGFEPIAEERDLEWRLSLHERSVMHYRLHMVACRRAA